MTIFGKYYLMTKQVVTRFAPSPTGFLHIGSARTALFNWLFAKANGGQFLLRIEDTDRARSTEEAIEAILDSMKWLELDWDGEPVYQFACADRHREIAKQLLAEGKAYKCYCSPEELEAMREKARAEGGFIGYDGTWRDRDPSEAPEGVDPVIRFKSPQDGETVIKDQVQGDVVIKNSQLDDLILLRSDGTPTYMLSVVVDDHDMGITHIIRGDDHLVNAARQQVIYEALGWDVPVFAHVSLIHGPDGKKLSKRHGALGAEAYRAMGYLPAAMRNYLVKLGWSHGDDEIFSTEQAIEWFGLGGFNKAPARMDFDKLANVNGHYIRASAPSDIVQYLKNYWHEFKFEGKPELASISDAQWASFEKAIPSLAERIDTLPQLIESAHWIFAARPLEIEKKALKSLSDEGKGHMAALLPQLEECDDWSVEATGALIKGYVESAEVGFGKVAQPLRAALTGTTKAPSIDEILVILGKTEAINRIKDQTNTV